MATKEKAIEEVAAAKAPESKPTVESNESPFAPSEETIEEAPPSLEEMAAYLGEPEDPVRGEDAVISDDRPIPTLDEADKQIVPKTKALMEELFRARLNKVQRINTKKIR